MFFFFFAFQESDIKGELQEIEIKRRSSAFMKHLSRTIGEGAEEPTVDDYGINNDPIRSAYLSSYDETIEGAKHVAFSDEDEDHAHVDSAGTPKKAEKCEKKSLKTTKSSKFLLNLVLFRVSIEAAAVDLKLTLSLILSHKTGLGF